MNRNNISRQLDKADAGLLAWLLKQPAIKAQAYFWNYSSRRERKEAMQRDMLKELGSD